MSDNLTRVTVNLIPKAADALTEAAMLGRDTKTDTINRALQVYAFILRQTHAGSALQLIDEKGEVYGVILL